MDLLLSGVTPRGRTTRDLDFLGPSEVFGSRLTETESGQGTTALSVFGLRRRGTVGTFVPGGEGVSLGTLDHSFFYFKVRLLVLFNSPEPSTILLSPQYGVRGTPFISKVSVDHTPES